MTPRESGTNNSEPFCGPIWDSSQHFITEYVYGFAVLIFETIGTPFGALTVIIFSKNSLSPSNILFLSLAISDLMVSLLGIPQLVFRIKHNHLRYKLDRGSYTDVEKFADHYLATGQKIFYNISLYQTTMLAVWRYVVITYPLKERILCNAKMTLASVIAIYTLCILCFIRDLLHPCSISSIDNLTCIRNEDVASARNIVGERALTLWYPGEIWRIKLKNFSSRYAD